MGYVSLSGQIIAVDDAPVYSLQQITERMSRNDVDEIIVALPPNRCSEIPQIVKTMERLCLPVPAVLDCGDHMLIGERRFQFGRRQILEVTASRPASVRYTL